MDKNFWKTFFDGKKIFGFVFIIFLCFLVTIGFGIFAGCEEEIGRVVAYKDVVTAFFTLVGTALAWFLGIQGTVDTADRVKDAIGKKKEGVSNDGT